ncbi:MAG: hypothetical protein AVDCRST_MAG05-5255, partial [uncultured Rubrobacteraceae bacterium]
GLLSLVLVVLDGVDLLQRRDDLVRPDRRLPPLRQGRERRVRRLPQVLQQPDTASRHRAGVGELTAARRARVPRAGVGPFVAPSGERGLRAGGFAGHGGPRNTAPRPAGEGGQAGEGDPGARPLQLAAHSLHHRLGLPDAAHARPGILTGV